jgi:hypothetical protein
MQDPQPAPSAELQQLKAKRVQIYHDVDLLGAGKPSPLHTEYLAMILQQAGATVIHGGAQGQKPDVVVFGEPLPLTKLDPAEAADPFLAMKAKRQQEEIDAYHQARPKLERQAADAGACVLRSSDVSKALRIRVTEPQIAEALDARARETLKRLLPAFDAESMSFDNVINYMRDAGQANIFVNWRALDAAGVDRNAPVKLHLSTLPLSEALEKLLSQAGGNDAKLGYAIRAGVITISTNDDLKAAAK